MPCPEDPRQTLGNLTSIDSSVLASGTLKPSPSAFSSNGAVPDFRECGLPYGLHGSLCTLRMIRSAAVLITILTWRIRWPCASSAHLPMSIKHPGRCPCKFRCCLLHTRNTRYGWLVKPYPAGTCTLQESVKLRLTHQHCEKRAHTSRCTLCEGAWTSGGRAHLRSWQGGCCQDTPGDA